MKRVLSLVITALVFWGCTDDEFRIGYFSIHHPDFSDPHITLHPEGEYSLSNDIHITDEMGHEIPIEDMSNFAIQWKSSNPEVAQVVDGIVYGIDTGIAVITASISDKHWDKIRVYVVRDDRQTKCSGPLMIELTDVTETTARFRAHFAIDEDLPHADEYTFGYAYDDGSSTYLKAENATKITINKSTDIELTNLWPGVRYSYAIYWTDKVNWQMDGRFVTDSPEESDFDLSAKGTANCYIVSQKGIFCFEATEGNSGFPASVETVKVLWETFGSDEAPTSGDLIEDIFCDTFRHYIYFKTNNTFKDGNALIAAYDSEEEIIWSWHIWFTEQEPREIPYKNNSGIMMDRNLGALSSTPDYRANGLLYQWGRKDPFIGSSSIKGNTRAKSTGAWPTPVISDYSRGTIAYSIAHPTTFICSYLDNDWDYSSSNRWTTSEEKKSKYDPCPAGWRVPDGGDSGIWAKACGQTKEFSSGTEFSSVFSTYEKSIYYPPTGIYDPKDGELVSGGNYFICWSATEKNDASDDMSYAFGYSTYSSYGNYAYPATSEERAIGASVRCMKE